MSQGGQCPRGTGSEGDRVRGGQGPKGAGSEGGRVRGGQSRVGQSREETSIAMIEACPITRTYMFTLIDQWSSPATLTHIPLSTSRSIVLYA